MENESKNLSAEESLKIIHEMIDVAKFGLHDNSFYFLLWGWVVFLANIGHYYLMVFTQYPAPQAVWLIALPASLISVIYGYRNRKSSSVKTYTGSIIDYTWLAFLICLIIIIVFSSRFSYNINPVIMLVTGMATFITGIGIRFKPLIIGGILFWACSIISLILPFEYQYIMGAISVIVGYLIPGYMLRNRSKQLKTRHQNA